MKCDKVQELILIDYLDGQVNEEQKTNIEKHLASCVHCKEYELVARETVITPFNNAKRLSPPEATWDKIRNQIEKEQLQERTNPFADLIRGIKSALHIPKPAFAVATAAIVILVIVTVIKLPSEKIVKLSTEDQIECIDYLLGAFNDEFTDDNNDFETSVEEYFL
ncbi:MAG: anti-sigma factor family protein [Planctomycetota bacterium]|jgi:anti-sigma factor RsiW